MAYAFKTPVTPALNAVFNVEFVFFTMLPDCDLIMSLDLQKPV